MRLIDADALKDKWIWGTTDRTQNAKCVELIDIDEMPSVDIIRCKDCKYRDNDYCTSHHDHIDRDEFCSRGVRKDG